MIERTLPTIGSSGLFKFAPPYNELIQENERLIVKGIRSISELLSDSKNPYDEYYKPYNITEELYEADEANDVEIISLMNDKGVWYFIPSSYIILYPDINGIGYRGLSMVVLLPTMPVERDYTFLKDSIKDVVSDSLGVTPVVKEVTTSKLVYVTEEIHKETELKRHLKINKESNIRVEYARVKKALEDMKAYVNELEKLM